MDPVQDTPTGVPVTAADVVSWHGCLGNPQWPVPSCACRSADIARPHYGKSDQSEYVDHPAVLKAKVALLVQMLTASTGTVLYTGAGISTPAGIGDYASKAKGSLVQSERHNLNRLMLQPTLSHRVLAALEKKGLIEGWLQQNHDGLAQKAGYPFDKLNEIHGSWFDRNNPVVLMDGVLRPDLYAKMKLWGDTADLCIALGTSLCGMNADCVAKATAGRFLSNGSGQGLVIVNLQHTDLDHMAQLRIYAKIDDVMAMVMKEMRLTLDRNTYSAVPPPRRRAMSTRR